MKVLKSKDGFTLVEILVAVGLLSVIFSFIFGVLTSNLEISRDAGEKMEMAHSGRFFINRITNDLLAASLMPNSGSGAFLGRDAFKDGKSRDELHFTAFTRSYFTLRPLIDQSEIGYYFTTVEKGETALMRRESDVIEPPVDSGGESFKISDNVEELKIRYLGNEGWVDSWDSTVFGKPISPKAVSVELTLTDGRRSYFFSNIVRIPA